MKHTTRTSVPAPAVPAHDVEAFVLDVHRTHTSWCYWLPEPGQARRSELSEVQAGTYPVRVETNPAGEDLAVVDLDTFVMRRITWRWIFPHLERPCVRAVSDVAWLTDEVTDGAVAMTDDDGTPLGTWRRLDTTEEPTGTGLTPTGSTPTTVGRCGATNGPHTCHLGTDHDGDHVCAGCHDRWNRGPWDDETDPFPDDLWEGSTCLDDLDDHLHTDELDGEENC